MKPQYKGNDTNLQLNDLIIVDINDDKISFLRDQIPILIAVEHPLKQYEEEVFVAMDDDQQARLIVLLIASLNGFFAEEQELPTGIKGEEKLLFKLVDWTNKK